MVLRNRCDYVPLSRTDRYENNFFPYTIKAWKNLDEEAKSKASVPSFKTYITKNYIRYPGHSLFGISDKHGSSLLIKIWISFSDLRNHRFSHNFNCVSPVCNCGLGYERTAHYMQTHPISWQNIRRDNRLNSHAEQKIGMRNLEENGRGIKFDLLIF